MNALLRAGSAELTLTHEDRGVRITVEDRGPGIAPVGLGEVPQSFVRPESARTRTTWGA